MSEVLQNDMTATVKTTDTDGLDVLLSRVRRALGNLGEATRDVVQFSLKLCDIEAANTLKVFIEEAMKDPTLSNTTRDIYEGCLINYLNYEQRKELSAIAKFMNEDFLKGIHPEK